MNISKKSFPVSCKGLFSIFIILSLGSISFFWFGGDKLILSADFNFFLSLDKNIFLRSYMNLGFSPCALFAFGPLIILQRAGFSLVMIEKMLFYFLFTFPGISMFYLTTTLINGGKKYLAGVISAFFYMINTYTWLIKWSSGYTMSLFAYAALPLMLAFYIKGLNEKRNIKYAIFLGIASLIAAPRGSTPTYIIVIWAILFLYLVFHVISQRKKQELFRSIKFTVISLLSWFLVNIWWIANQISSLSVTSLAPTLTSESYNSVLLLNGSTTSFLNVFRLMGFWLFEASFKGDLYYPVLPVYSSSMFILISFLIPVLGFGSLIIKGNKKYVLFFATLSIFGIFLVKKVFILH